MTPEELQLIVEFKEKNPGMGVKKTVEGLRASIPSITSKMVRSVVLEIPEPPPVAPESRPNAAPADAHRKKVEKQIDACYKRPALLKQGEMTAMLQFYGHDPAGKYGLLARGNTVYEFEQMFWVDVVKGDTAVLTLFARLKVEAVLGHREAVWMLWKLLKTARDDTAEGTRLIKDEHIARQLEQELGTNPTDLDADLSVGAVNPSTMRLAALLGSIKDGIF
ncbi:hypothetical protein DFH09DRAFT_1271246 [Mycena vulgaris]|nr:hypothetical protein DFH09DRAFT_1271246 [Mycena vulgaris]